MNKKALRVNRMQNCLTAANFVWAGGDIVRFGRLYVVLVVSVQALFVIPLRTLLALMLQVGVRLDSMQHHGGGGNLVVDGLVELVYVIISKQSAVPTLL